MREVPVYRGDVVTAVALVDDCDFDLVSAHRWFLNRDGYASRSVAANTRSGTTVMSMHREVANTPRGFHTDHIDGNKLNNTRSNLRICTHTENMRHRGRVGKRTGLKGAFRHRGRGGPWKSAIRTDAGTVFLGCFQTEEAAHAAYAAASAKYHGAFAL